MDYPMHPIAHIHSDFATKFGIPRQSGLVNTLRATVVFTPEYRNADALRGVENFSHLWLIWVFSESVGRGFSPTVRPPRLGGNTRLGVFATRSPFRPNPIGLSSVKLEAIRRDAECGAVLDVSGADLMDGTPILDIKPYLPYTDLHSGATGGFTASADDFLLEVHFPDALLHKLPAQAQTSISGVLAHDPRPSYQEDSERIYGVAFAGFDVRFRIAGKVLTVLSVEKIAP